MKKYFFAGVLLGVILGILFSFLLFFYVAKVYMPNEIAKNLKPPKIDSLSSVGIKANLDLELYSLSDTLSPPSSLLSFKGKVLFINFWENWCAPCIAELPSIKKLKKEVETLPVEFCFLSQSSPNKALKILQKYDLEGYHVKSNIPECFLGNGVPRTYIVDKFGNIILKSASAKWDDDSVIKLLKQECSK